MVSKAISGLRLRGEGTPTPGYRRQSSQQEASESLVHRPFSRIFCDRQLLISAV